MSNPRHGQVVPAAGFTPAAWLPGPHLPTLWASLCRRPPAITLINERVELDDGDFVDLVWTSASSGPCVVLLHGLEGSRHSSYARALIAALDAAGYRAVLLQFRGCSGVPNRRDRSYHSGDTGDLAAVCRHISARDGHPPFAAVGYSLGGNVLLKWLGELGPEQPLTTAIAVSPPFHLAACADRLNQGASRLYQWHLVRSMQRKFVAKFRDRPAPLPVLDVRSLSTFWAFDDAVTAPLHGFRDAVEYYARASSRAYLGAITIPTLIVHALNDPFVPARAIPQAQELAPSVTLELARGGGHVGFISGSVPGRARYWLEPRIIAHLDRVRALTHADQ